MVHSRSAPTINPLAVSTPRHLTCTWYLDVQVGVNGFKISLSNSLNAFFDKITADRREKKKINELVQISRLLFKNTRIVPMKPTFWIAMRQQLNLMCGTE